MKGTFYYKTFLEIKNSIGAIHKGSAAKTRISRPLSPLRPDKTIKSHSNNN